MAALSLTLSIVSIFLIGFPAMAFLLSGIGLITGIVSLAKNAPGQGSATAGVVIGVLVVCISGFSMSVGSSTRKSANRSEISTVSSAQEATPAPSPSPARQIQSVSVSEAASSPEEPDDEYHDFEQTEKMTYSFGSFLVSLPATWVDAGAGRFAVMENHIEEAWLAIYDLGKKEGQTDLPSWLSAFYEGLDLNLCHDVTIGQIQYSGVLKQSIAYYEFSGIRSSSAKEPVEGRIAILYDRESKGLVGLVFFQKTDLALGHMDDYIAVSRHFVLKTEGTETAPEETTTQESQEEEAVQTSAREKMGDYEREIVHFRVYADSLGDTSFDAIVAIYNTSAYNLYLGSGTFDIEDSSGHLLGTEDWVSSCPDIVPPGETGYYYCNNASALEGLDPSGDYVLVPRTKVSKATASPVWYEISDTSLKNGTWGGVSAIGRLTNQTKKDIGYLYINVIYYDAAGSVIGITGTSLVDIPAGETASFEIAGIFLPKGVTLETVAAYEIVAQATHYQF